MRRSTSNDRRGFTLLEVILAISISILVLGLVGTIIYFQLRVLDADRGEVQRAQLARALLRHIANDVRNVVKYDPLDVESLVPTGSAAAAVAGAAGGAASGDSGGAAGGGSPMPGPSIPEDLSLAEEVPSEEASVTGSLEPEETPGLYGDEKFLKIDVSRLPRRDELLAAEEADGLLGALSDVKTVSYFVTVSDGINPGGLMRSEVSRVAALTSQDQGGQTIDETLLQTNSKLLAPEVVDILFAYHDGEQWHPTWPPEEAETQAQAAVLPVAVHIILFFKPDDFDEFYEGQATTVMDISTFPQRRMIVQLPAAEPVPPVEETTTETEGTSD